MPSWSAKGFKVVGEASNAQEALKLAETVHPEVAVLDFALPLLNGINTVREIQRVSSKTRRNLTNPFDHPVLVTRHARTLRP